MLWFDFECLSSRLTPIPLRLPPSHTWGSGQNQMQALKKELALLVPSLSVFLDVENLTDLGDLEGLIESSEVVLIFLSSGYFSRWNCLREARQTLVAEKEVIVLREVAKMHGGGSMSRIAKELEDPDNSSLYDAFDSAHESSSIAHIKSALEDWCESGVILWHRGERIVSSL